MSTYELNKLMYDLRDPVHRDALKAGLEAYLNRYKLTDAEKSLVREGDWQGLVDAGVSIYVLTKIGAVLDISLYQMGAQMRAMSSEQFWQFLAAQNERNKQYAILP